MQMHVQMCKDAAIQMNGFYIIGQKMKLSIKDFFSQCDQICRNLQTCLHLLKKSLMENFIFSPVYETQHWVEMC